MENCGSIGKTDEVRCCLTVADNICIALWAALVVATALAGPSTVPHRDIVRHIISTFVYFAIGLKLAPTVLTRLNRVRWNILASISPVGHVVVVLFV